MTKKSAAIEVPQKKPLVSSPYKVPAILGQQGQRLIPTITQDLCGTTGISACMVYMPPGKIAKPHFHDHSDVIIVVLEGYAASLIGSDLKPYFHGPGEFMYIPEGEIHVAVNLSMSERLVAIEMRTDPKLDEDTILSHEYNDKAAEVALDLQNKYAIGELHVPDHWDTKNQQPFRFDLKESDF